ncbi:MAG: zinc ribbon domain-containing protein [Planctomycetota bacterium]|jgi:predicted amidophosphoribosyltransferase
MPIPVTCPECGKQVNAPDKFAGKRVKCPDCKNPMQIPAGGGGAGDDMMLDSTAGTKKTTGPLGGKTCPNCGKAWSFDDLFCTECGTNLTTGKKAKGL